MGRIEITKLTDTPVFRKLAMGTWRSVGDPSVYGILEVDMTNAKVFMETCSRSSGVKITPGHLVGKAITQAFKERPEINGLIRGSRIYLRKHVDLFYQVNIPGGGENSVKKASLSGTTVFGAESMSVVEIAQTLNRKSELVKTDKDSELSHTLKIIKLVPWSCIRWFLNITSFLCYGLNLNLKWLGIPKDPFGSVMITNVGSFGIDLAFAPLVPYSRVPLLLTVGAMKETPAVKDGQVVIKTILPIGVTFDHRFMDGVHAAQMARAFKRCFEEPERYFL